jgi:hypothetical protein
MPAATPMPRGPSVLTLYRAADLLTRPGCPVCRYTDEASGRYLGWFALEGHSDPGFMATLRSSLGMCDRHTRFLCSQPGAAIRLTAVYRYIVPAARDLLAGRGQPARPCPACEHDRAAADRALETLADGIATGEALDLYRELGGVCVAHLRSAVAAGPRRIAAFLVDILQEAISGRPAHPEWLAGIDRDAEFRTSLRRALPATGVELTSACAACLAAAYAERDCLELKAAEVRDGGGLAESDPPVCARHLADMAGAAADTGELWSVLSSQADRRLREVLPETHRRHGPASWPWGRRSHDLQRACPVCRARAAADAGVLAEARRPARSPGQLCVRHYRTLRSLDQAAALTVAGASVAVADRLTGELTHAFEQTTWAVRRGAGAPESSAWRRAAAFLDGRVFGAVPSPSGRAKRA